MSNPVFNRRQHLGLAVVALGHGPIGVQALQILPSIMGTSYGPGLSMVARLIHLCFAAFIAWLAFAVVDTRSGVTILPASWRDIGWRLPVVFALAESAMLAEQCLDPSPLSTPFVADDGALLVGWLVASTLAGAIAEEIVYRALLLRGLEGYIHRLQALVLQALVFHVVHVHVYGYAFSPGYFGYGLLYGWAFMRTRSLAVPTLLHATHNLLYFTAVWWFNQ